MVSGPSDKARAASVAKRLAGQAARIAALRDALAHKVNEVETSNLDRSKLKIADIYGSLGIKKPTFYRYRSENDDIKALCKQLEPLRIRNQEPVAHAVEPNSGDSGALILNLMQQVATAKVFINMLELERRGHLKDIKSMRAGIKALASKNAVIAGFADRLRRTLVHHGIEIDANDLPPPVAKKPDLRVVYSDREEDDSLEDS